MYKKKSVQINMILNMARTIISIAFPLITYPYATRVLQAENYGKVTYASTIVSYFALIAALGISSYAVREGAIYRKNKEAFKRFANEIFSINIFFTCVAYLIFFIIIKFFGFFQSDLLLLEITSLSIIFTTLNVEWINIIYEDFLYITVRSFLVQIVSLLLLFIFVKSKNDFYKYALLQVINSGIIAILNFKYTKKYCRPHIILSMNLKKHIRPIMILFSNSLAVSIYLNIDNVFLGMEKGTYYVGIYSVAVKVYTILKQIIASIYTVTVTRLSEYIERKNFCEYNKLLNNVINNIIIISVPIAVGITSISESVVNILAGESYVEACIPLNILSFAVFFAVIGGALAYCVNLPYKRENKNLKATIISALINFMLNFIAVPLLGVNGAALTTVISEISVCIVLFYGMKDLWFNFELKKIFINLTKCIISSIPMIIIRNIISLYVESNSFCFIIIMISICIIQYVLMNLLLKNENLTDFIKLFKKVKK